jgi:pyruvate,water dikinase
MDYLRGFNPQTGEWNDSLTGNYLWANTNIGETMSDVMTPFTWSLVSESFERMNVLPGHSTVGNIAGRAYYNVSVMGTALRALGRSLENLNKEMGGVRADDQDDLPALMIPIHGVSFFAILVQGVKMRRRQRRAVQNIPDFLDENPAWFRSMRRRLLQIQNKDDLVSIWLDEIVPYVLQCFWMVVGSAWEYGERVGDLRRDLIKLVGEEDADALLSNVSQEADLLASLGPAMGLAQVARGEMDREVFLERWGHRGPSESELSIPRPAEDSEWLDRQIATLARYPVDVSTLLDRQQRQHQAAWTRFARRYPRRTNRFQRRLQTAAESARTREAVRSEQVRLIWIARIWALRAGDLTGLEEDIFHLTGGETVDLLLGKQVSVASIPTRKRTHTAYKNLPPYPVVIRGPFDPFHWAADPDRRTDFYDFEGLIDELDVRANRNEPSRAEKVIGVPGSAGVAEGVVHRIDSPEEGMKFQPGEILVTVQTNIGWSHLFPLAKAIVTDVGAALSHAAIVAREMGIPAVVNCGDATLKLRTGDRVRVDGSRGVVEILESAPA